MQSTQRRENPGVDDEGGEARSSEVGLCGGGKGMGEGGVDVTAVLRGGRTKGCGGGGKE